MESPRDAHRARIRDLEAEVRRLRAQNRQLVDDVNEAEENTRVYRRLAHRFVTRCGDCPTCNPPKTEA